MSGCKNSAFSLFTVIKNSLALSFMVSENYGAAFFLVIGNSLRAKKVPPKKYNLPMEFVGA
jgi:hypothetical protein